MPRTVWLRLACLILVGAGGGIDSAFASPEKQSVEKPAIERLIAQGSITIPGGDRIIDAKSLKGFYATRNFEPAWTDAGGAINIDKLSGEIRAVADAHGLDPTAYQVAAGPTIAETDLCVSDALVKLGHDLSIGRLPPVRLTGGLGPEWRPKYDPTAFLRQAQSTQDLHVTGLWAAPHSDTYLGLMKALATYRTYEEAGGWTAIPEVQTTIKPGESDSRIPLLRKRLVATGELSADKVDGGETLDDDVVAALKKFQAQYGLDTDGALGKRTLSTLNVSAKRRVRQIAMTLERLRESPRTLPANRIEVNIASQFLTLYNDGVPSLAMRVVVGDVKHQTPTMATRVSTMTLNPTWTVPASIARKEILPKLKKDPNYLANNNIRLLDPTGGENPDMDGTAVDWNQMGSSFPFVLRQKPGPDNALGQMKFNLQDQDAIYMHDTPQKRFFQRSYRALSHGCIRLEHPMDLADNLLSPHWKEKLPTLLANPKTSTLGLARTYPVFLYYQTAWIEADGSLSLRDDIYGNDYRLDDALKNGLPPEASPSLSAKGDRKKL